MARSQYIYVIKFLDGDMLMFTVKWEMKEFLDKRCYKAVHCVWRYRDAGFVGGRDTSRVDITEECV